MRIRLFAFALAATVLTSLSTRAEYTFTGPGLFTDTAKWSSRLLPTNTVDQNIRMKGHCGATNVAERLQGGKWCHIGYGGQASWLDVKDCDFYFATLRISNGGYKGVYTHDGGSAWFSQGFNIGYEANYMEARMELTDAAVTNANSKTMSVGSSAPKDGGTASLKMTNCSLVNSGTLLVNNGATATFRDCAISGGLIRTQKGGTAAIVNSSLSSPKTGALYAGHGAVGTGTIAFTNSIVNIGEKVYLGGGNGYCGIMDFKDSAWTNKWQVYVGNADGSTGLLHVADSRIRFNSDPYVGYGASSLGEVVFDSGSVVEKLAGSYAYVGVGSNAVGRLVFSGVDWSKITGPGTAYRFASGIDSIGQIVYRDIEGQRAYTLATVFNLANTNGYAETVFDNAHYSNSSSAYFGQSDLEARVVVCNGSTFEVVRSGDIWIPNATGSRVIFSVTNSPMFHIQPSGSYLKHEKANAQLHFTFYDSTAYICTNGTFNLAQGAGSEASFTLSGDATLLDINDISYINGQVTFNLDGGVFRLGKIQSNSGYANAPTFNFNGGTLRSKSAQSSWFPATSTNYVCEGGAVFEAQHNVTIPGLLRHGGEAAKDGGVVKKGSGTLTLSSATAHDFTGDIVVEEGTLVMTALSDYVLAAGQKIGGSGTLKVGSGFIAGGVRFDGTWSGSLTVDGDVSFAPGSTVDVTGVTKKTEQRRFTILSADAVSGAENLSAAGMPDGWKLRVTDKSVSIVRDDGFIFVIR